MILPGKRTLLFAGALVVAGAAAPVFSSGFLHSLSHFSANPKDSIPSAETTKHGTEGVKTGAEEASELFSTMQLEKSGLKENIFEYAYKGYKHLVESGIVVKDNVLSICDFSQSSRKKRLYVIDLQSRQLLINTYVAHGRNSGKDYANSFSNAPESHKSSLGFYLTDHIYQGAHGKSLRIRGLEKGFNDRAWERAIVIHGADYVSPSVAARNGYLGRSFGCPAVPMESYNKVINTIKDGSCLFIYHPSREYLVKSGIINS